MAIFYAEALHYKLQEPPKGYASWEDALREWGIPEEDWHLTNAIVDPEGAGPRIFFQRMDTPKIGKNRLHLEMNLSDGEKVSLEERKKQVRLEVERLTILGATIEREWEEQNEFWVVMLDPEGNEFCVQ